MNIKKIGIAFTFVLIIAQSTLAVANLCFKKSYDNKINVTLYNRGKEKFNILYEKTIGAKTLNVLSIKSNEKTKVSVEVGCSIYHNIKGSKGPLILIVTKEMKGTTQTINQ